MSSTYQFPILSMLSCPALTALTVDAAEVALCTTAQFPALKELGVFYSFGQPLNAPLARESRQLETLTIFSTRRNFSILPYDAPHLLQQLNLANPDSYTSSLRRFRLQFSRVFGAVRPFESVFQTATAAFAERGQNVQFELIQLDSQ
jgi:hypothetical protein